MFAPELVKETAAAVAANTTVHKPRAHNERLELLLLFFSSFFTFGFFLFFYYYYTVQRFVPVRVRVCVCKRRQKCLLARIFFTLSRYTQCARLLRFETFAFFETVCALHLENTLRIRRVQFIYIYISKAPAGQQLKKKIHHNRILLSLAVVEFFESAN